MLEIGGQPGLTRSTGRGEGKDLFGQLRAELRWFGRKPRFNSRIWIVREDENVRS
jgi:hypothetical protein